MWEESSSRLLCQVLGPNVKLASIWQLVCASRLEGNCNQYVPNQTATFTFTYRISSDVQMPME